MTLASTPPHRQITPLQAFHAAVALEERGRSREAERLYQYALALSPDHVASLLRWSTIRVQRGDLASALTLLRRAAGVAPQSADAHAALGCLLATLHYARGDRLLPESARHQTGQRHGPSSPCQRAGHAVTNSRSDRSLPTGPRHCSQPGRSSQQPCESSCDGRSSRRSDYPLRTRACRQSG